MDVVITYVDINDKFRQDFSKYVKQDLNEKRFRSYGVLDLQIKMIRKYMSYVNNIFVIVSDESQVPDNLDLKSCKIIYHRDIIPEKYLPCFNSCTIEMFIYRIPGLDEKFIYFNDDIFVINYINEEYFFKDNKPCLQFEIKDYSYNEAEIYKTNLFNSTKEISKLLRFEKKFDDKYIKMVHSCRPFLKSTCEKVFNKLNFKLVSSLTRTRHSKNFNATVFNDYDYMSLNYINQYPNYTYIESCGKIDQIIDAVNKKETPIICINDNDDYIDFDEFKEILNDLFKANLEKKEYIKPVKKNSNIELTDNLYVSFTSWSKRINNCKHTVDLMMNQTLKPTKIILNLSEEEFPNKENDLPKNLVKESQENSLFEIYWVKENNNVWKKIIPTMNRYPKDLVLSIDDDIEYPSNYIEEMYKTYCENNKLYPVVGYDFRIDNGKLCHSGPFTLTSKIFYGDLLNDIYDDLIKPTITEKKWQSDLIYYKVALANNIYYIKCNKINGNLLYKKSELNKKNQYSIWDNKYKAERDENIKLIDNWLKDKNLYLNGISICISAYKSTKYIKETLNSVKNQTWFKDNNNWECIIGIDGCYETLDYIKAIMNEYDNNHFSFYMMNSNKGTYITSNTLMSKIAKYNWVLRFDSDDIMYPNMVETIINNIDKNTDIIRFNLQNFADESYTLNDLSKINKSYISYGQICIRHDKFNRYGGYLPWKCSADAEFLSRTRKFLKQKKIQDILFKRRITDDSLTNSSLTNNKSKLRQEYDEYIKNISLKIKDRKDAINNKLEINSYYKIISYELIISLTSFPERIKFVKKVLESIINTSIDKNIYKLVIVLSIEEFPNKENDLPIELTEYCYKNNIEIIWHNRNIRSHKKLIPTIKKYPSVPILIIDDDIIRTEEWFKMFINDHRKYPQDILCMRCDDYITKDFECIHDRSNFEDGVQFENYIYHNRPSNGCGGLLYPAYTFNDNEFYNEDLFMKLSPSSDEMWQFCFNVINNQKIRRTSNLFQVDSIKGTQQKSLYKENKGKYTFIMQTLLDYFPKYKENLNKLFEEENSLNTKSYKAIIAITSWKKRISNVYKTITNLLILANNQYKIVLTLSIEEFPNKENDLPDELISLLIYDNFEINWIYKNYKVFKKLLFTMQKYQNLPIISADDDIIYKYNYLDELYNIWLKNKKCVISEGYEIKYTINNEEYKFSKGCASLYPPGCLLNATKYLNDEIINTQNDDSFYGIYFHLNNIKIINVHNNIKNLISSHTNNDSITINVKTREDFYKDKLIILENINKYKEV